MLDAVAKDDWRWCCRIHWPLTFDVTSYNSLFNEHLAQLPMHKADMYSIFDLWELLATVSQSLHYIIGNTTGSLVGNQLTKLIMMSTWHIFSDLIPVSINSIKTDVEWFPGNQLICFILWELGQAFAACCYAGDPSCLASFFSVPILLPGQRNFLLSPVPLPLPLLFLSQL